MFDDNNYYKISMSYELFINKWTVTMSKIDYEFFFFFFWCSRGLKAQQRKENYSKTELRGMVTRLITNFNIIKYALDRKPTSV